MLVEVIEVVGLHDHVIKLKEGKSLFHSLLIAFCRQHTVNGEASTNLAQKLNVIEPKKPIGIVYHNGLVLAEFDEFFHLLLEAFAVMSDGLGGHHRSHVGTAGGISDMACTAADQNDGLIACHLQSLHEA